MDKLTIVATIILSLFTLAWIVDVLSCIFSCIFKKRKIVFKDTVLLSNPLFDGTKRAVITLLVLITSLVLVILDSKSVKGFLGLNGLEDSMSGTYCFYVEAKNMDTETSYTLPAQINIENDPDVGTTYYIAKICFDDGSYRAFPNGDPFRISDKSVRMTDSSGKEWECTLINKRAFNSTIIETDSFNVFSLAELAIMCLAFVYNLVGFIVVKSNKKPADEPTP